MKNLRIGLDIDDTVTNTNSVLMKYAYKFNEENGNKPLLKKDTNNFGEVFGWNDDEVYRFFRTYYLDALKELELKEGVKEVLTRLKNEGHEISFITVRNDRECAGEGEARRITEEFFSKYEVPYDNLYLDIHDKATFCTEHGIDIFMDDSTSTVRKVKETGITTCLAMNNYNLDFEDEDIIKIYNMEEFYNTVQTLSKK